MKIHQWIGRIFWPLAILAMLVSCSDGGENARIKSGNPAAQYVLAFSWQPAFCEGAPKKPECRSQHPGSYEADHFSLHGLWPQPGTNIYCGVEQSEIEKDKNGRWNDLKTARIAEDIWRQLQRLMPGTRSALHKHEWIKHGTCTSVDIDEYFSRSIDLLENINGSTLQALFQSGKGKQVTGVAIRKAFDQTYGDGAGDRLRISCKKDQDSSRLLITEITLGLANPFESDADLSELVAEAPQTDPGCPSGIVDPAGFQ